jgi:ABC-2 type transport system permease protein
MQYRIDFVIEGFMSLYWQFWNLVPLLILYSQRQEVSGWSFNEALIVIGWFTALRGILEGAINPSLVDVVDRIRTGSFDYVLLKPVDTQFLISTARFSPWKIIDLLSGIGIACVGLALGGHVPTLWQLLLGVLLTVAASLVLYSLWILIVCACFWVVRLDNLTYLFSAVFDAARWPVQIFKGFWRFLFTFIFPLAIMTTYPAMALLGRLDARTAAWALGGAASFFMVSRLAWRRAIAHYRSASS